MLPPELEVLIKIAASDGVITPAEKDVLLKKAASLGADIDEVEKVLATYDKTTNETESPLQILQNQLKELAQQQSTALLTIINKEERRKCEYAFIEEKSSLITSFILPETEKELREAYKYCLKQETAAKERDYRNEWRQKSLECCAELLELLEDNLNACLALISDAKEKGNEEFITKTPRARQILKAEREKAKQEFQAARIEFLFKGWGWRRILAIVTIAISTPVGIYLKFYNEKEEAIVLPIAFCAVIFAFLFANCISSLNSIEEDIYTKHNLSKKDMDDNK